MGYLLSGSGLSFFATVFLVCGFGMLLQRSRRRIVLRRQDRGLMGSPVGPLVQLIDDAGLPALFGARSEHFDQRLKAAGRPLGGITGRQFLSATIVLGLAVFVSVVGGMSVSGSFGVGVLVFAFILSAAAVFAAVFALEDKVAQRRREISRSFPYFLDLMVMVMSAGGSPIDGLQSYIRGQPKDALAEELAIALRDTSMAKRFHVVLGDIGDRIDDERIRMVLRAIRQSVTLGNPMDQVLKEQATDVRFIRSQEAEKAAEALKVKIQLPAMLVMVGALILILAPAVIEVFQSEVF